ncbi:MAG: 3-deoxy-D-manno-octulosonic acid transferase [bacterium]|uniref:3-deoxy-D-manno-octulosonic acid transferase n=1 Tax=Candidatus Aphodosoma intestinipullorum TaxID=2840674 RepID=A0A940IDT9_9BACT|nr:3-deoxy-D-manno-octulosonic acid transferase [Candidatus Aphodosoma intestinipullorum]
MHFIYNLGITLYGVAIALASLFSNKARLRYAGGRAAVDEMRRRRTPGERYIWFHAASLGEFEQGRALMERLRASHPEYKIALTFFSPSGYEVRKGYAGADVVTYLPLDRPRNVRAFLDALQPEMAVFVKYEYWGNFLFSLKERGVRTYVVSAIFRPDQVFFRPYGGLFVRMLGCFTKIYVQDERSRQLLSGVGIESVEVAGDTRFDRVADIVRRAEELPVAAAFAGEGRPVVVAGSTWPQDEELLARFISVNKDHLRMIIVPHEVSPSRISELCSRLRCSFALYTQTTPEEAGKADCLVVDTVGILSSLYRYGRVAYVGGGFGAGIHNTLEAAVWGIPVVWGPNYHKFKEAEGLAACGGGCAVASYRQMEDALNRLLTDSAAGASAGEYVRSKTGATDKILAELF